MKIELLIKQKMCKRLFDVRGISKVVKCWSKGVRIEVGVKVLTMSLESELIRHAIPLYIQIWDLDDRVKRVMC